MELNLRYRYKNKTIIIMKKIISGVFIASLGGMLALGADHLLMNSQVSEPVAQVQSAPVRLTNYSGVPAGSIDFTMAAEKSLNAVVHIKTTIEQTNNISTNPFEQWFYGNSRGQTYTQQASGSGVIISGDGYIVTNNHVVNRAKEIEVMLNDKRNYKAEIIGADPNTDIALIKIKEKDLPFILYGNSDQVRVGEWALAVGNPFNLKSTVTAGIISAKGRNINILEGNPIESFIQTDAAVNPGNSGGALVNTDGELIGINTAIASNNGTYQGYAFAVPVNIVKKVVADLAEFGSVQRAYIGVSINDIDAGFAQRNHIKQLKGAYINGLTQGGAAETAGLKTGDVVMQIEENKVNSVSELQEQISKYRPGDKINVKVVRNEKEVVVPVTLKNSEGNMAIIKKVEPVKISVGSLGAIFEDADPNYLAKLKIHSGVKVAKLSAGKLYSAGIKEGFIITSIDKKKVSSVKDVQTILENKKGGVLIEGVYPNGMSAYYGFGI